MPSNRQSISVVICAYTEERWGDLVAAVDSVKHQTRPPDEIIVVIDHNPRLLQRAEQELDGLIVVPNQESRGLSGARNSGIAAASGSVIAFIDEDAVAEPDWLERLGQAYQDARVLGVGGAVDPMWLGGRPGWFPEEFDWVVGCTYLGFPTSRSPVRNLIGCNMSMRREVFSAAGGFQSGLGRLGTYPAGCEETELCIRARSHSPGRYFLYEPGARVRHHVPARRATWKYFSHRCFAEGISKARVSQLVGMGGGTASERRYTTRTLPQGVARGILATLTRGDPTGLARAGAIMAGLALTTAGFLKGMISLWLEAYRDRDEAERERGTSSVPNTR